MSQKMYVEDKIIILNLWDTAGQEQFRAITQTYYRNAVGACVVFDLTSWQSFKSVAGWLRSLKEHAHPNIVILLIGNKSDLNIDR